MLGLYEESGKENGSHYIVDWGNNWAYLFRITQTEPHEVAESSKDTSAASSARGKNLTTAPCISQSVDVIFHWFRYGHFDCLLFVLGPS